MSRANSANSKPGKLRTTGGEVEGLETFWFGGLRSANGQPVDRKLFTGGADSRSVMEYEYLNK